MEDLSWTDELCADDVVSLAEAPIHGGKVKVGAKVALRTGALPTGVEGAHALPPGTPVTVVAVAAGFKGKAPFRKRLWVALHVQAEAGEPFPVMADGLEVPFEPLTG